MSADEATTELLSHADGLTEEFDNAMSQLDKTHTNLQDKIAAVREKPQDTEAIEALKKTMVELETANAPSSLLPPLLRILDSSTTSNSGTSKSSDRPSTESQLESYPITKAVIHMDSFDGTNSQLFDDWFSTVLHYRELFRWTDHQTLFYAAFKLRTEAARVFRNSCLYQNSKATLKDFVVLMGSMFTNRSDRVDVWRDIFNGSRKAGESLKQYAKGLALLFQQVDPPLSDDAKIHALCRNVEADFSESAIATARQKTTFATAVEYLESCEHIRDSRKRFFATSSSSSAKKMDTRPYCSHHKSHTHSTEECRARAKRVFSVSNSTAGFDDEHGHK